MAPHSSTLAWKIPWMEEPSRLQSMGSIRVGHNWATSLSLFTFMHWRRKWQPTRVFLPGESQGRESLVSCCTVRHDWSDLAAAVVFKIRYWYIWGNLIHNNLNVLLSVRNAWIFKSFNMEKPFLGKKIPYSNTNSNSINKVWY